MSAYKISRDGLADLALPYEMDAEVRAAVAANSEIQAVIDQRISAQLDANGWDGDWSAVDIITAIFDEYRTTYTAQIEASNADGTTWQAVAPSETTSTYGTPADLADDIAANQTIATGDNWRVVLWDGADADTSSTPAVIWHPGSVTAAVAPTLDWAAMSRHLDVDHVEKHPIEADTYIATTPDGNRRAYFGLAADPDGVCADGEHPGWAINVAELVDGDYQDLSGSDYYEPRDLDDMLARVAALLPEVKA